MSHIVQAKTSIKHPDLALLTQAVKLVAQQHSGGRIADHYLTFARSRRTDAQLALFTSELDRGMGLKIKKTTGELTFIGDYWAHEELAAQIQQQILQTYVSLATMQALAAMGYQASAVEGEQGQLVLVGVSYE
jgi:hypothetical protein